MLSVQEIKRKNKHCLKLINDVAHNSNAPFEHNVGKWYFDLCLKYQTLLYKANSTKPISVRQ